MWSLALKILKDNWGALLLAVVIFACGIGLGTLITRGEMLLQAVSFSDEKQKLKDDFSAKERQWDQERLRASGQYATDLKAALDAQNAWHQKADQLTAQLDAKDKAHALEVRNLKQRLKDALESDGDSYTGIGPAGLQLFREALGYPGTESLTAGNGLSQTASGTAGNTRPAARAGGGLSSGGIVSFSADYGAWCLNLRDRLQAVKDSYRE